MAFLKLDLKPGIVRDTTEYSQSGGWYDSNRIRFRSGKPETISGWQVLTTQAFSGYCRSLFRTIDNSGTVRTGLGTTCRYYIESGGQLTDVTPIRQTNAGLINILSTTISTNLININEVSNNVQVGDHVIITGASAIGGIPSDDINGERDVYSIIDNDNYTILVATAATSTVSGGGGTITIEYLYFCGVDNTSYGTGYGTGTYGHDTWGSSSISAASIATTRIWNTDNFGEDLIINVKGGPIYYWDATAPSTRIIPLTSLPGASDAPTISNDILVNQQSRHVIAFGANALGSPTQNKMLVRWSDQEDAADWTPTAVNQAGDMQLNRGSQIVCAIPTRSDILIFTNHALFNMQYIGGELVFGFTMVADNVHIIGANGAIGVGDSVYWMSHSGFYVWNGRVDNVPCTIESYILADLDFSEADKVYAASNITNNELIWFYQSVNATEVDKYVAYNYVDGLWYYGSMARTSWIEDLNDIHPIAASTDGFLYTHEFGEYDGSTNPGGNIGSFITSSPIEIADGDSFMFVERFVPDIEFSGSVASSPTVTVRLSNENYPGGADFDAEEKSVIEVDPDYTTKKNVRLRGRSIKFKLSTGTAGTKWRAGSFRLDGRPDGAR